MSCICRVLGTQGEPRMSAMCASVAFSTFFLKKKKKTLVAEFYNYVFCSHIQKFFQILFARVDRWVPSKGPTKKGPTGKRADNKRADNKMGR